MNLNFLLIQFLAGNKKDPIFYAIAACIFGLVAFINGLFLIKKKRMIENMPTSKIKSAAVGFVEIYGRTKKYKEYLLSPWEDEACVYYDMHIERWQKTGKSHNWVTVKRDTKHIPFYLEDDSEKILVDLEDVEYKIRKDHVIENGSFSRLSPRAKEFLDKHKVNYKGFISDDTIRISEDYIAFGDSLYVLGSAKLNDKYKEKKNTDKNKLFIGKNKSHPYFFVSDSKESELLKDFGKSIPLKIYGGGLLSIVGMLGVLLIWYHRGYFLFK